MQGKAHLFVRAIVPAADRTAFDDWYRTEHLPDAVQAFGVARAWRGWSRHDASAHLAIYEFDSVAQAEKVLQSAATRGLIDEFDRVWQGRVSRTREVVELAGSIPG